MGRILIEYSDHFNYASNVTPHASEVSRTWVRNDIGTADITFPMTTPNLWGIIQWGRIFRIHELGVPSWVGMVTDREWSEEGVTLHLKSAEWMLYRSITGQGLAFPAGTTSGKIAYGIFASSYLTNRTAHPIHAGIFDGTKQRFKEPYNYADCWEELKRLADEDGADVWVDEKLYCHYRDMRGTDKSATIKLREGKHLVGVRVHDNLEDTITAAVGLGAGDNIVSKTKISTRWNADPGYERTEVLNFDNETDSGRIAALAQQAIRDRALPRLTVDAEFVKEQAGEFWGQFFVGDIIEVMLSSYMNTSGQLGLNARAQVLGVELGGEDRMRLVLELLPADTRGITFLAWTPTNAAV